MHARSYWGDAYDRIPKSVFATVAWHLANVASGTADTQGAAEQRFIDEVAALARADIIPERQAKSVTAAAAVTKQWKAPQ